ncbi:hypothetical protein SPLC1_S540470 [Arthrospira platensis C1]|nr:hypothetical protein SPLC1_S540470 [Arthrospira platensis C1]
MAVDLGINTTATVTVVTFDGTVIHRELIHPGPDIDRRYQRLESVAMRALMTMGKGGKLHKGFCAQTCLLVTKNLLKPTHKPKTLYYANNHNNRS